MITRQYLTLEMKILDETQFMFGIHAMKEFHIILKRSQEGFAVINKIRLKYAHLLLVLMQQLWHMASVHPILVSRWSEVQFWNQLEYILDSQLQPRATTIQCLVTSCSRQCIQWPQYISALAF